MECCAVQLQKQLVAHQSLTTVVCCAPKKLCNVIGKLGESTAKIHSETACPHQRNLPLQPYAAHICAERCGTVTLQQHLAPNSSPQVVFPKQGFQARATSQSVALFNVRTASLTADLNGLQQCPAEHTPQQRGASTAAMHAVLGVKHSVS